MLETVGSSLWTTVTKEKKIKWSLRSWKNFKLAGRLPKQATFNPNDRFPLPLILQISYFPAILSQLQSMEICMEM